MYKEERTFKLDIYIWVWPFLEGRKSVCPVGHNLFTETTSKSIFSGLALMVSYVQGVFHNLICVRSYYAANVAKYPSLKSQEW